MKMKEPKKTLLSKIIKENVITEYVGSVEKEFDKDIFNDNKKRLFRLLLDHSYLHKQVKKIRGLYDIPEEGFTKKEDVFLWEHFDQSRNKNFNNEVDLLVSSFSFHSMYRQSVWFLFYDFITYLGKEDYDIVGKIPVFSIIKTVEDWEVNKYLVDTSSMYIEIFDWTTKRDMDRALKQINEIKKGSGLPFKISKVSNLSRRVWEMSQEGLSNIEISKKVSKYLLDKNNKKRFFGDKEVATYKKRYERALSSLRKI